MASKKKNKQNIKKYNNKPETKVETPSKNNSTKNTFIMKFLVFLGVIISLVICIYLMNYFFVERSYLKINMSTDKKIENIVVNGEEQSIATQKYVSDLNYTMRYDIDKFTVFKYRSQDIFKYKAAEKILVMVEKSTNPENCNTSSEGINNCMVTVDDYTEEYYITASQQTYKITIKTPGKNDYADEIKARIDYMVKSFEIV